MAIEFLDRLDESAESWTFQTFDDFKHRKDPKLACVINGDFDRVWPQLYELSQCGAGVFVTVNETDGNGRKLNNMRRIRAVWHEDDEGVPRTFPLRPDMVVSSSPGKFHRYWLIEGQASTCQFRSVMECLVHVHGSDRNAKDLTRVLRLPGFYNRKYPQPHLVRLMD